MNNGKRMAHIGIPLLLGNRRGHAVALILLYLLLLVEYYGFVYGNYFSLMGFDYRFSPVAFLSGLLMLAAAVAMLAAVPGDKGRLYTVGVVVAMIFCLPQIVLFQIGKAQPYGALYSLLLLFFVTTPLLWLPQARTPRLPARWLWWLLPLLALLALIPFVNAYGLSFNLQRFTLGQDIYQARAAASARGTMATGYLRGLLTNVMLPLMLVYGLCCLRRRWWLVVLALAMTLYLFFVTPQKSILFSLGLVAACFVFRGIVALRSFAPLWVGGGPASCHPCCDAGIHCRATSFLHPGNRAGKLFHLFRAESRLFVPQFPFGLVRLSLPT